MATANELYAMPYEVNCALCCLIGFGYNHIKESGLDTIDIVDIDTDRVEIRTIKYFDFDGRRFWMLATVWFDSKPVMVIQNAGREGDDHAKRYVTDKSALRDMCQYIRSLVPVEEDESDLVDADEDIPSLTEFYGNELDGHFERYR